MIPQSFIDAWRLTSPWSSDLQVEQDLVVSRAMAEMYGDERMRDLAAVRGGTVLNKFYFGGGSRYSEDIDLVKITAGRAGPLFDIIRGRLDAWLGKPKREVSESSIKLFYRFPAEMDPAVVMRLKIEVNMVENFSVLGYRDMPFSVESGWFSARTTVRTFALNELLGTKLRALYQRRKGRDLFDLWYALSFCACVPEEIVQCFLKYMEHGDCKIGRRELATNLQEKIADRRFLSDVPPLIKTGLDYDAAASGELVCEKLISLVPY